MIRNRDIDPLKANIKEDKNFSIPELADAASLERNAMGFNPNSEGCNRGTTDEATSWKGEMGDPLADSSEFSQTETCKLKYGKSKTISGCWLKTPSRVSH